MKETGQAIQDTLLSQPSLYSLDTTSVTYANGVSLEFREDFQSDYVPDQGILQAWVTRSHNLTRILHLGGALDFLTGRIPDVFPISHDEGPPGPRLFQARYGLIQGHPFEESYHQRDLVFQIRDRFASDFDRLIPKGEVPAHLPPGSMISLSRGQFHIQDRGSHLWGMTTIELRERPLPERSPFFVSPDRVLTALLAGHQRHVELHC